MYKYTAHPEILRKFNSIEKNSKKPWDDRFFLAIEITGSSQNYFACGGFWKNYKAYEFYSIMRRAQVPLNGVLIPEKWFTITEV